MSFSMTSLVRLILIAALGANAAAIILGGLAPSPAPADWRATGGPVAQMIDPKDIPLGRPLLLHDPEGGRVRPLGLDGAVRLEHSSCSPFRSREGGSQVAGLLITRADDGPMPDPVEFNLARIAIPSGEVLDRVAVERMPVSPPCWYPDAADRVLFASGDGKLYSYTFKSASGLSAPGSGGPRPRPLVWGTAPPGHGGVNLNDPAWPTDPRWEGRIVVSLCALEDPDAKHFGAERLWWLALDRGGTRIEAAAPLLAPESSEAQDGGRRSVAYLSATTGELDGRPLIAFLKVDPDRGGRTLCVAPIEFDPSTSAPSIPPGSVREVAHDCGLTTPAFSADGRWISCVLDPRESTVRLARFSVEAALAGDGPIVEDRASRLDQVTADDLDDRAASE